MPISIQRCAEATGIDGLDANVAEALAEDASYRIREIVNISAQFMKRSRRSCLQAKDVSKALKISNIQPILGEDHVDPPEYDYIEEEDFHYLQDDIVNLEDYRISGQEDGGAMSEVESSARSPSLMSEWLLLDGQSPVRLSQGESAELPSMLMDYFNYIVTCILGEDKVLRHESLSDLKNNSKISPLLSYFVNFVSNVKAVSHDLEQLFNLLQTVSALVSNPYVNLMGYLKPMTSSVLYCVLESLTASINPLNDHWGLRDYGGRLLAFIIQKYGPQNTEIAEYIKSSIKNILLDTTRPLCSHYGAIVTINSLGISAIKTVLCPNLLKYYTSSLKIIEENTDSNNLQLKEDAYKVVGVILHSVERLILTLKTSENFEKELYAICEAMLNIFGDAVACRIPIDHPDCKMYNQTGIENFDRSLFGPRIAKLSQLPRRTRTFGRQDIFGPKKFIFKKIDICLGSRPQIPTVPQTYVHSQFYHLHIKTANVGKCYCLTQKKRTPFYHDYISTIL